MIDEMLLKKAGEAESIDELVERAAEEGISLERTEAGKYFGLLNRDGEISDDDLDSVSGGGCKDTTKCPSCGKGEPFWRVYKDGSIRISCTTCPAELDYVGGQYIVKAERFV